MSSINIYTCLNLDISKFDLNDKSYYVYIYLDPFTELPFYIGKGKNGRLYEHLTEKCLKNTTKFYNKLNSILSTGHNPIVYKIQENLTNYEALNLEHFFIEHFGIKTREGGLLYNSTVGGRGGNTYHSITDEARAKRGKVQSQRNVERFKDLNVRKKMSERIKKFRLENPEKSSNIAKLRYQNLIEKGTAHLCTANIAKGNKVNFLAKKVYRWMNDMNYTVKVHNLDDFKTFLSTNRNILVENYSK